VPATSSSPRLDDWLNPCGYGRSDGTIPTSPSEANTVEIIPAVLNDQALG
jgi:hypothetical protein